MPKKLTTDEWIARATKKHGGEYGYSNAIYTKGSDQIEITCKVHGSVWQNASNHLSGARCLDCAGTRRLTTDAWILLANAVHDGIYDYSKVEYKNATTRVTIICQYHGEFEQIPRDHRDGHGCTQCATESRTLIGRGIAKNTTASYITSAMEKHDGFYDYSQTIYETSRKHVTIICPEHGPFSTRASSHLLGTGCGKCMNKQSKKETDLYTFVKSICPDAINSDRSLIKPYELDIVIPSMKIAIEFCGLYWHTDGRRGIDKNYHKNKFDKCNDLGIQLITIFEDEWDDREIQVKNKIKSLLGIDDRPSVYARKCTIGIVSHAEKVAFYNNNHIQGDGGGKISYGLYNNSELVACMTFKVMANGVYYLNRYATSHRVVGGAAKLLTHFKKNHEWSEIISFADCRWSNGNLYYKTGWELDSVSRPDYSYFYKGKRKHKFGFRRKNLEQILGDKFNPAESETVNTAKNGIHRLWDCGKMKFKLTN